MNTYEIKLKGLAQLEDGGIKLAKMKYIVTDSITCGEAENAALVDAAKHMQDVEATSVQVKALADMVDKDADRLWYVKIQQTIIDDLSAKEKKVALLYLVGADSAKDASNRIMQELSGLDCEVVKISDSKVDFVIPSIFSQK